LLSGNLPFQDKNRFRLYQLIKKAEYSFPSQDWDKISEEAKDLVKHLIEPDPNKRFSAEEAINHSWFKVDDTILTAAVPPFRNKYLQVQSHKKT